METALEARTSIDPRATAAGVSVAPRLRAPQRSHRPVPGAGESSDSELMARVGAGDHAAFSDLVDRYKNTLVNYLSKMTRSRDRAEELAQDAFVRVYRSAAKYRERGAFSAYLFRIATNVLRSEERRKQRWRGLSTMLQHHQLTRPASPQRLALSGEASAQVTAALLELPVHYRAPLVLREIEGWAYAEIAAALDCREGTVKSRINRAKARLRELLRPYWEGEPR